LHYTVSLQTYKLYRSYAEIGVNNYIGIE